MDNPHPCDAVRRRRSRNQAAPLPLLLDVGGSSGGGNSCGGYRCAGQMFRLLRLVRPRLRALQHGLLQGGLGLGVLPG